MKFIDVDDAESAISGGGTGTDEEGKRHSGEDEAETGCEDAENA